MSCSNPREHLWNCQCGFSNVVYLKQMVCPSCGRTVEFRDGVCSRCCYVYELAKAIHTPPGPDALMTRDDWERYIGAPLELVGLVQELPKRRP